MKLYIGNKNYSSWSMRPWVLLRQAGIAFDEVRVRFDSFDTGSEFKRAISAVNPTGKVPVLVDGDLVVWDTLAIAEYLADKFPDNQLWPQDTKTRARARSVCAEIHSGFINLRTEWPMNARARAAAIEAPVAARGHLAERLGGVDGQLHLGRAVGVEDEFGNREGAFAEDPLRTGIVQEGEFLRAKSVALLRAGTRHAWLEVVVDEGRNRHIRRLLAALHIDVLRLVRVAIGPLQLGDLPKGEWRALSAEEAAALGG